MATAQSAKRRLIFCGSLLTSVLLASLVPAAQPPARKIDCRTEGALVRVAELPEASGVAAARQQRGRAWSHNDSGDPVLVALDERGHLASRVRIAGAEVEDWEALAAGPCPSGWCLYIADIGDNDAAREHITIYRVPEPATGQATAAVTETFNATYPDGKHDAETILVSPKGTIFIVTKGETGPVALYRFPDNTRPGATVELVRVGQPRNNAQTGGDDRITDGAVSPDGAWVVLRTNRELRLYATAPFLSGKWPDPVRVDLGSLGEPQGEGVTFADNQTLLLAGEGGGASRPGTFARLSCSF